MPENLSTRGLLGSFTTMLLCTGATLRAIKNYRKSVGINPGNTNGLEVLEMLGVEIDELIATVEVDAARLQGYCGPG